MNTDDPLEELELLQTCEEAVTTLLIPDIDLDAKARDNLGVLLSYLNQRRERALELLRASRPVMRMVG